MLPLYYPDYVQMKVLAQLGIEKLKATSHRREVPDGGMTGLYLIVQPSGSKSYALRYRHNGRSKKLTLGKYPKMSLLQARDRAREALESISYGEKTPQDGQEAHSALSQHLDLSWNATFLRQKELIRQRGFMSMIFYPPFEERSCRTLPSEM